ncbi:MAG: Holliday junction branch migration protein RuvA [Victivallaceae bacterium]|nr:Holliday junction branch migration protein RuvA [Victivallaceae bacterium]
MIAHLHGTLLESDFTSCVIDCNGVGYDVSIPLSTFDKLPHPGETADLFIHTQVREDAITLFGFAAGEERKLFRLLLGISGIGGKLALNVLSAMPVESFNAAILAGDVRALSRISGIGKRTAERMVLELKDKLGDYFNVDAAAVSAAPASADAALALEQLGFKRAAINEALKELCAQLPPSEQTSENLLRQALQKLNR